MRDFFKIGGCGYEMFLSAHRGGFLLHVGDKKFPVNAGEGKIVVDGMAHDIVMASAGNRIFVHHEGEAYEIKYIPAIARFAESRAQSESDHLIAPMPGAVIACAVEAGDEVEIGAPLLVIESMKLETPFKAWRPGKIAAVHVGVGQNFERDKVLLSMEPA